VALIGVSETGGGESDPGGAGLLRQGEGQQWRPKGLAGWKGVAGRRLRLDQVKSQRRQIPFSGLVNDVNQVVGDAVQVLSDLVTVETFEQIGVEMYSWAGTENGQAIGFATSFWFRITSYRRPRELARKWVGPA